MWTPMVHNYKLSEGGPSQDDIMPTAINGTKILYASVVGSLMYAMLGLRPDLAYVVGILGRYTSAPRACHWEVAKRTLRYLQRTRTLELRYKRTTGPMCFMCYSDSDWSGDEDTSRSTSGYVFMCNRGAVSWSSKRQKLVAMSSTEAKYIALSNVGQELVWLRRFFAELGQRQRGPIIVESDNMGAITLSQEPQFRA